MSKKKWDFSTSPKFKVRDKVRVIRGFMDVDYPDMPLGGWAGTVTKLMGLTLSLSAGLRKRCRPSTPCLCNAAKSTASIQKNMY